MNKIRSNTPNPSKSEQIVLLKLVRGDENMHMTTPILFFPAPKLNIGDFKIELKCLLV